MLDEKCFDKREDDNDFAELTSSGRLVPDTWRNIQGRPGSYHRQL